MKSEGGGDTYGKVTVTARALMASSDWHLTYVLYLGMTHPHMDVFVIEDLDNKTIYIEI
jgi:hypothetical protein